MLSKKTQTEIDKWESRTHVYVDFSNGVKLEGLFFADELSEIANIQRKRLKELSPTLVKTEQKGLFDD